MTAMTTTLPVDRPRNAELGRIWNVVRLHFTNKWNAIGMPWLILGFIFLVNLAIWWIIALTTSPADHADAVDGFQYSGSSTYIFVYMLIVAIQAINFTFPFALGFGVTRRDFYLGTSVAFVIFAAIYGAALTLLSYIEQWTKGWGFGGRMFTAIYFSSGPVWERFFVFFAAFMVFLLIGLAFATVYVRWRSTGLTIASGILLIAMIGAVALVTLTRSWPAVWGWLGTLGPVGIFGWLLVPSILITVIGFFVLRRATPKN